MFLYFWECSIILRIGIKCHNTSTFVANSPALLSNPDSHLGKNKLHIYWNFIFPPIYYCFYCGLVFILCGTESTKNISTQYKSYGLVDLYQFLSIKCVLPAQYLNFESNGTPTTKSLLQCLDLLS
jgi:hypothetical protein